MLKFTKELVPKEIKPLLYENDKHHKFTMNDKVKAFVMARQLIEQINSIDINWAQIVSKTEKQYAMMDGDLYIDNKLQADDSDQSRLDRIIFRNQKQQGLNPEHLIIEILKAVFLIEKSIIHQSQTFQYCIVLKITGKDLYGDEIKYNTGSIELKSFIFKLFKALVTIDKIEKQESLRLFWKSLGFDTSQQCGQIPNNLVDLSIYSFKIFRYKGLQIQPSLSSSQIPSGIQINLNTQQSIYAISRARIQYLGQNIPIFKFQHCLFEALMSAIHPEEVTPEGDTTDFRENDLIRQEKFLYSKFLEFQQSNVLQPLIKLSSKGLTEEFIHYFNSLTESQNREYSRFKISLYDINQRKFVIDFTTPHRKAFFVHYNGYVFGTNHAKMFTIREREIGLHQQSQYTSSENESDSEEESKNAIQLDDGGILEMRKINRQVEIDNIGIDESAGSSNESEAESSEDEMRARDDIVSEVDMRTSFVMSSNIIKSNNRRKKILAQLPKNEGNVTSGSGLLALKIEFENQSISSTNDGLTIINEKIKKLVCFGSFPWVTISKATQNSQHASHIFKTFEGPDAHFHFMIWLLKNVVNYRRDSRSHSRFINIFTYKGSSKELPLLLKALISIVGRDAHFIGDLNKLKMIWYENIKFYDFVNYFEGKELSYFKRKWLTNKSQIDNLQKTSQGDQTNFKVLLIYETVFRFIDELQSIAFNNGKNFYDLTLYGQASASSLALSIFQYMFLDKQHIKGTNQIEIYEKEKASLKGAFFSINRLSQAKQQEQNHIQINLDELIDTYRLYEISHSIAGCFKENPIPFEFIKSREYKVDFTFEEGKYSFNYRFQQSLDVWHNQDQEQKFKIMHTSLYKVEKLQKQRNQFILPQQTSFGLDLSTDTLTDQYIWGVELIQAIIDRGTSNSVIKHLVITEELNYLQGKLFTPFVSEIWDKFRYSQNQCQKDILHLILTSFHSKFNQNFFGLQQVIHINDLNLMKQTCLDGEQIHKLHELQYPYYCIDYHPTGSDQLQQICSLTRITSYINACHRVKIFQYLTQFSSSTSQENVLYLDHQYLLLKNRELIDQQIAKLKLPMNAKSSQPIEQMGRYRLIAEKYGEPDMVKDDIGVYMQKFRKNGQKQEQMKERQNVEPILDKIVKNFSLFKILVQKNHSDEVYTEDNLIEEFLQILLSNTQSSYQLAPNLNESNLKHHKVNIHSQKQFSQEINQKTLLTPQQVIQMSKILKHDLLPEISSFNEVLEKVKQSQITKQQMASSINQDLLNKPESRLNFLQLLKESATKFEYNLTSKAEHHSYERKNPEETFSQTSNNNVQIMNLDSDSHNELMSQQEFIMAMQCCEDSSQNSVLSRGMVALAKQSNGNLVSEFFSQTNTR